MKSVNWQSVGNEILPEGFNMLASLLAGEETGLRFGRFRLLDSEQETITESEDVEFTSKQYPDIGGARVEGTELIPASDVTSDVHYIELLNNVGSAIARAELDEPVPEGQALLIARHDFFGAPDKLEGYDPSNGDED